MNFECSLDRLIESRKIEKYYTCQFIWHITIPIIGGFMFGYNTGVISGALILIKEQFKINTITQEMFVGATVLAAFVGSLLTGYLSNKFGRKKVMILSCVFFIIGCAIMISENFSVLILGRVVVGIGVGMSSACCPIYIAEMTPKLIRGRIVALYQVSITFGMFLASIFNALFHYTILSRFAFSVSLIPALFAFFGLFTISESYRWLLSKNRIIEAKDVIVKLNQIPIIDVNEFVDNIVQANEIIEQHLQERSLHKKFSINKFFIDETARKSLIFGCSLQILGQIVGINTIMYYTATVIQMLGTPEQLILWLSSLVAFFNFLLSFVGVILIDKIGRRKLLIVSLLGIFFSLVILALSFQIITVRSQKVNTVIYDNSSVCNEKSNCEYCISSGKCGFCFDKENTTCLVVSNDSHFSQNGWCMKGHSNKYKFQSEFCKSDYTWIIMTGMIFYIISYTIGMGPIPWIVTSEIYPIWCRSFNMSLSTASNWLFNWIITFNFLTLTENIYKYGTFWLYSLFTFCGIVLVYKYLPETQKVALEEIPPILSE